MLDGVNLDGAFRESGGALDGLDLFHIGIDEGLVGQIDAAELESVTFRRGLEREGDLLAGVEGSAFEGGLASESVLNGGGHGGAGFIFTREVSSRNGEGKSGAGQAALR